MTFRSVFAVAVALLCSDAGAPGSDAERELLAELRTTCERADEARLDELLRSSSARALPVVLDLLESDAWPAEEGAAARPLGTDERRLLLASTAHLPAGEVRAEIDAALARQTHATAGLALLAEIGVASDLRRAIRLAALVDSREPLERAVERIVVRDETATLALSSLVSREVDSVHFVPLARGVAASGVRSGLGPLARMIMVAPEAEILTAVAELASGHRPPFDEDVRLAVRTVLESDQESQWAAAADAAAALEDIEAVNRLVQLVDVERADVRFHTRRALQHISGEPFGCSGPRWRSWWRTESDWWMEHASEHLQNLVDGGPEEIIASINALACHGLHRHELAEEIAKLLEHEQTEVRIVACAALGQLRSPTCATELVRLLDDDEPAVRTAAWTALRAITRLDLPLEDPDLWREHIADKT